MLSWVKVMIALGGNREKGAGNEKKENIPDLAGDAAAIVCGGWEARRDTKVRNTLVTMKVPAIITRGGRMIGDAEGLDQAALQAGDGKVKSHPREGMSQRV